MRAAFVLLLLSCLCAGCSKSSTPSTTLVLIPGQEVDAFTRDPKPSLLEVRTISSTATATIASMQWPTGEFDIGDLGTSEYAAFEAIGRNASGGAILRGRTLAMQFSLLDGAQVPLFMGRVGEMARPPGSLSSTSTDALAGIVDGELLVLAGGTDAVDSTGAAISSASASAYDLGLWDPLSTVATLPRTPASMAVASQRYGLLIDAMGATWVDFDSTTTSEVTDPTGTTFAAIAGGKTVYGSSGEAYVIGATRATGAPTAVVLRVGADLSLATLSLTSPRLGASAAWIDGRGLVVAGGSSEAAGAELLASGATQFSALPFPADATAGAGATGLDALHVLLVGGQDAQGHAMGARLLDASCVASCATLSLAGAERAQVLAVSAWALSGTRVIAAGTAPATEADAGQLRVTLMTVASPNAQAVDVPLREPRKGAVAAVLPTGMVAIAGGRSPAGAPVRSIELFIPPE